MGPSILKALETHVALWSLQQLWMLIEQKSHCKSHCKVRDEWVLAKTYSLIYGLDSVVALVRREQSFVYVREYSSIFIYI